MTLAANAAKRMIVIDEVQRVRELQQVVHQLIELNKSLIFVLTGSSSRKLRTTGVDLLAGRGLSAFTQAREIVRRRRCRRVGAINVSSFYGSADHDLEDELL